MKNYFQLNIFPSTFFLVLLISIPNLVQSTKTGDGNTCLDLKFENTCYSSIKSSFNDYVYLKSRPFSYEVNGEANFSILLKKNVQYIFNACPNFQTANSIELKLYNENNTLLATGSGEKIIFQPEKAGKYHITTSLGKNNNNCCLILCGMLNKYVPSIKSKSKAK